MANTVYYNGSVSASTAYDKPVNWLPKANQYDLQLPLKQHCYPTDSRGYVYYPIVAPSIPTLTGNAAVIQRHLSQLNKIAKYSLPVTEYSNTDTQKVIEWIDRTTRKLLLQVTTPPNNIPPGNPNMADIFNTLYERASISAEIIFTTAEYQELCVEVSKLPADEQSVWDNTILNFVYDGKVIKLIESTE